MLKKRNVAGVYVTEKDQSATITAVATNSGAEVVRAPKGITNREVIVSSYTDYVNKFGDTMFSASDVPVFGYGAYAANAFLNESNELHVLRIVDTNDKYPMVKFEADFGYGDDWQSSAVDYSGVAAILTPENPDTPTTIQALDNDLTTEKMLIGAVGPGIDGEDFGITIETFNVSADWMLKYDDFPSENSAWGEILMSASNGGYNTLSEMETACSAADTTLEKLLPVATKIFKINVYRKKSNQLWEDINASIVAETITIDDLSPIETYYGTIGYVKDASGNQLKITEVINGVSDNIHVVTGNSELDYDIVPEDTFIFPLAGGAITYKTGLGDTDLSAVLSGWEFFREKEYASVRILINPDWNATVKQTVANIAATRMDCVAVGQSGKVTDNSVEKVALQEIYGYKNPSYMGLYAGWDLINDAPNNKKIYIPKAVFGPAIMARCDAQGNTWDAPSGTDRGVLPTLGQNKVFKFTEIGRLQDLGINTSRWFKAYGHVMWGQKTAQIKASALDRLQVRRLLIYVEATVEQLLLPFCFNIVNDDKSRTRISTQVNDFLGTILSGANPGATAAEAVCDENNNPSIVVDASQMVLDMFIAPAKSVEAFEVNAIITKTGVSFTESVA
jgi:uncharacterized protein